MEFPWKVDALKEWLIVGMNHYKTDGELRLFVAMTRNGKCVVQEGPDGLELWEALTEKAKKADIAK